MVFHGETMRNMKTPLPIRSVESLYNVILSISIHILIFSIPISSVVSHQIQEMELFISMEDIQVPIDPAKTRREMKKPRPYPVKETNIQAEVPRPQIKEPEIITPVREGNVETVREVKEEYEEEVKDKPTRIESNSINEAEPVNEAKEPVEKIEDKPIRLESNSVNQPVTESREAFFVPPGSNILEKDTVELIKDWTIGTRSNVENQQPVSHNMVGIDTSSPIETKFGASIAPAFLHREMPVYPMMARKLGREGKVVLKLTIDENGNLLNVEVVEKAGYGFTEAAVEAVKKSTFLPAKKDGKPLVSRALLPIRFRLERN